MSKKYIPQINNNNFVYPNNDKVEYDQTIIHDINNNVVTGSVVGVSLSLESGTLILGYQWAWNLNGAKRALTNDEQTAMVSVHMMTPDQDYFKPWRMVANEVGTSTATTGHSIRTLGVSKTGFGVTSWPFGEYKFEFRLIGEEAVVPICVTATLEGFSCVCEAYSITNNSAESTAEIQWEECTGGMVGNIVQPSTSISICACEGTLSVVTVGANVTITDDGLCNAPTPTPSPTSSPTPTPTMTLTPTPTFISCTWWRLTAPSISGEYVEIEYTDCDGVPNQFYQAYWNTGTHYVCAKVGTVTIQDLGVNGSAEDTLSPCVS